MSSIGSNINVPSSNEHTLQPANFTMSLVGGVYQTTPVPAGDGESQGLHVDDIGSVYVKNLHLDPLYIQGQDAAHDPATALPVLIGAVYNGLLPTYDDGDATHLHTDSSGRLITSDYQITQLSRSSGVSDPGTLRVKLADQDANYLDGLEGSLSSIVTTTTAIVANTVGLDALSKGSGAVDADTLRVKLSDEDAENLDGLETVLGTISTNTTGLGSLSKNSGPPDATTLRVRISDTEQDNLDAIQTGISTMSGQLPPALGSRIMTESVSVTLASNQPALPVSFGTAAALTVKQAAITVGTTAIRLTTDAAAPSTSRKLLRIQPDPNATGNFFYGSSSVTATGATRGCQIFPGQTEIFEADNNDYYIICDTAAQTVFVVEVE